MICDDIEVVDTGTLVLGQIEPVVVEIDLPDLQIEVIDTSVEVIELPEPAEAIIVVQGGPGPPGPPGAGVQEVYVQQAVPAQGTTPWFLAQLDGGGDVEFIKVYEP